MSPDNIRKECAHCSKQFTVSKYHVNRQKYCTDKKCRQDRNILRSKAYRVKYPDYHKKSPNSEYRTKVYNGNRSVQRKMDRLAKRAFDGQKQMFVDNVQTFVSLLEFYLFTFLGMTSVSTGGLRQTSAFNLCNLLDNFYKDGVSLVNSDANFKSKLEVINEFVTQFTQSPTSSEIAEVFQLDGSTAGSPRPSKECKSGGGDALPVSVGCG